MNDNLSNFKLDSLVSGSWDDFTERGHTTAIVQRLATHLDQNCRLNSLPRAPYLDNSTQMGM